MSRSTGSDAKIRLMTKKVSIVDVHFAQLGKEIDNILRTEHKLADRWDEFAERLTLYGEQETSGVKLAVCEISTQLKALQEHRRAMAQQMDDRVLQVLKAYPAKVKEMQTEISDREKLQDKAALKKRALDKLSFKDPTKQYQINKAKAEVAGLNKELSTADKSLAGSIIGFEREKLDFNKQSSSDLIKSQMAFACRTLEVLTAASGALEYFSPQDDLADVMELRTPSKKGPRSKDPDEVSLDASDLEYM